MSTAIPHEEDERLRALWAGAVDIEPLGPSPSDRIKLRGYNIRVKFPEAFFAAYHTFEAVTAVGSAIAVHATWPIAVSKCYHAAMSLFSTLVETVKPLSYVTAVILSTHETGAEALDLEDEVNAFLDNPKSRTFPWYLGMDGDIVEEASGDRDDGWFKTAVQDLEANGFLTKNGTRLLNKEKHVEWKVGI